jgi:hypothetical protein
MESMDIQDFCYNVLDCSWFYCAKSCKRDNSMPSWKPCSETNNESKIEQIYRKCNHCSEIKKVFQFCSSRGNNLYFCSSNCWEKWIQNSNQIKNDEYDSDDFFIL